MTYTRDTTLRRFYATPGVARSFCGECGGMLSWRRESSGTVSVAVGTIDRDDLKACRGGLSLAVASTHIWCAEEIPGVTDNTRGQKWKYGDGGERM
ncbi:Glutathione-dependent formaldehyde-activating enzyme [Geosmithia morbida]|uniref:Glutathione-dependent formaldehyde-activating enzyme n=1 Tax=Geosmithia morbida TaxID=1094350 RepID=A0A9P4YYW6_9HYPO|nr:Glutathione-dependent formaldehyde-activating enzyme [Geosmithia morbida]KAF4124570.1 Glutathione-dependent formaldehyde-activating enzyme [Geosmithia morbida]